MILVTCVMILVELKNYLNSIYLEINKFMVMSLDRQISADPYLLLWKRL